MRLVFVIIEFFLTKTFYAMKYIGALMVIGTVLFSLFVLAIDLHKSRYEVLAMAEITAISQREMTEPKTWKEKTTQFFTTLETINYNEQEGWKTSHSAPSSGPVYFYMLEWILPDGKKYVTERNGGQEVPIYTVGSKIPIAYNSVFPAIFYPVTPDIEVQGERDISGLLGILGIGVFAYAIGSLGVAFWRFVFRKAEAIIQSPSTQAAVAEMLTESKAQWQEQRHKKPGAEG